VKEPATQIMRDASDTMLKFGGRFGFTPTGRENMSIVAEPDDGDDIESALTG
jgi:phage terminase small subunit